MASSSAAIVAPTTAFLLALVIISLAAAAEAQPATASCISNLVPCANYLNSTNPPPSCCNPLRDAVTHQLDCLCSLYNNPDLVKQFQINLTQAQALPGYCKIPGNTSSCKALAPGSSSSSHPPPATVTPSENKSNGADIIAYGGLMELLLMLGASLMLW